MSATVAGRTMRPHEAVILVEGRLRAGVAIRLQAERLLAIAEAQEAEAVAEVAAALGQGAADMALAFVRMTGDPVEAGYADVAAIPGLLDRVNPCWTDAGQAGGTPSGPTGTGEMPTTPTAHLPASPVTASPPVASLPPQPPTASAAPPPPTLRPPASEPELPAPPATSPAAPALVAAAPEIPRYRPDRPLDEAERKVLIDSLTPETFDHERLDSHMRLLRPKGTVITPWVALPPFPRTGKDKDVTYLDVQIRAKQRHELQDVVYDAIYLAHADRKDLCVLYDKCMGYGVWRRKVFRAVMERELGIDLPPVKSANARARRAATGESATGEVSVHGTDVDAPVDTTASGTVAVIVATGAEADSPTVDDRSPPPATPEGFEVRTDSGDADPTVAPDSPSSVPTGSPVDVPAATGDGVGRYHDVEVVEEEEDDEEDFHGYPDDGDAEDDMPGDPSEGEVRDRFEDGEDEEDAFVPVAAPAVAAPPSRPLPRLASLATLYPGIDFDARPPRTILDDLPHDVARRHGLLPASADAGSPPPVADDGTVGEPVVLDADSITRPGGVIRRALAEAFPVSEPTRLGAPGAAPAWVPTPPGVRADGNLPPLDPATVRPSPFPKVGPPPFEYGYVGPPRVRAEAGYEQAFADARANRPMTPPSANAMGG